MRITKLSFCLAFLVGLLSLRGSADEMIPQVSMLKAGFIDPYSEEFAHSNLRHESERDVCTCPSIFAANTYTGPALSSELIQALEYAQCLWSCILAGTTPGIKMRVNNVQTSGNVLASAGTFYSSTDGQLFTPCARLGGTCSVAIDMNIDPDAVPYYFGTDGAVPTTQYDFVTVIMHELGHGFGFSGFIEETSGSYSLTAPRYILLDKNVKYSQQYPWNTNPVANPTLAASAVVSSALYYQGRNFVGKLYAPNPAQSGSSVYHWDELAYPKGNPDSLMTPVIYNGEANHIPGQMFCDLLVTIGYNILDLTLCGPSPISVSASRTPTPVVSFVVSRTPTSSRTATLSNSISRSAAPTPTPSRTTTRTPSKMVSTPSPSPTHTASRSKITTPTRTPSKVVQIPSSTRTRTPSKVAQIPSSTRTRTPSKVVQTPSSTRTKYSTRSPTKSRSVN